MLLDRAYDNYVIDAIALESGFRSRPTFFLISSGIKELFQVNIGEKNDHLTTGGRLVLTTGASPLHEKLSRPLVHCHYHRYFFFSC